MWFNQCSIQVDLTKELPRIVKLNHLVAQYANKKPELRPKIKRGKTQEAQTQLKIERLDRQETVNETHIKEFHQK